MDQRLKETYKDQWEDLLKEADKEEKNNEEMIENCFLSIVNAIEYNKIMRQTQRRDI